MAQPVPTFLAHGVLFLHVTFIIGIIMYGVQRLTDFDFLKYDILNRLVETVRDRSRELALLTALIATSGSLYFSNILQWEPCRLCWFQRIFMYPLILLLGVGILFRKDDVRDYVIPMSLIGLAIAVYHYPIQLKIMSSPGCSQYATSCSMTFTNMFGYITVPIMSATAFLTILLLMWKFD